MRSLIIISLITIYSSSSMAKIVRGYNLKKAQAYVERLKEQNIDYELKKSKEEKDVYYLLVQDSKQYSSINLKRQQKVTFKKKSYFIQLITLKREKTDQRRQELLAAGVRPNHIIRIKKRKEIPVYIISVNETEKTPDLKLSDYFSAFSMAQSKLFVEGHVGDSEYQSGYVNALVGFDYFGDEVTGKLMGRIEIWNEESANMNFHKNIIELDEAYLNKPFSMGQLTVGKQLFSWGVFDELSSFDRVNIKNLPRFVFDSGASYRRPITAMRYQHYSGSWKWDGYVDFGLEKGRKQSEESLWTGISREEGTIRGGDPELIAPSLITNVRMGFGEREDQSYGVRITRTGEGDVSFTYLNAYPDVPGLQFSETLRQQILLASVDATGLSAGVDFEYFKEQVFGLDYVNTFDGQLYKVELAYILNSAVLNEVLEVTEIPKFRLAIGGDFEFSSWTTTLTWQVVHEQLLEDQETFLDNSDLIQYILQSSTLMMADKLRVELRAILNGADSSLYFSPYFGYDLSDTSTFGVAVHIFNGHADSFFGFHDKNDFLEIRWQKLF
ncbi:MAG: hypothetical protein R2827_05440 [Bdellovibrionales bacterium]